MRHLDKKMVAIAFATLAVLVLLAVFVVKPSVVGYAVYREAKSLDLPLDEYASLVDDLSNDLVVASSDLGACMEVKDRINTDLSELKVIEAECKSDLLASDKLLDDFRDDLKRTNEELVSIERNYLRLVSNMAKNVCCKARVDDSSIDSYAVENYRIVCLTGGELPISC
jgi:hypothetical protein